MSKARVLKILDRAETREALRTLHSQILEETRWAAEEWMTGKGMLSEEENKEMEQRASAFLAGQLPPARYEVFDDRIENARNYGLFPPSEDSMTALFDRVVMSKLDGPLVIDSRDLCDAFCRHLRVWEQDFDSAYEVFVGAVAADLPWKSTRFVVGQVADNLFARVALHEAGATEAPHASQSDVRVPVSVGSWTWERNGISVDLRGVQITGPDGGRQRIRATLSGEMTNRARAAVRRVLRRVLPSMVRTLGCPEGYTPILGKPCVAKTALDAGHFVLTGCVDALFASRSKKDSLVKRICNAVLLLAEADGLEHDGIALAITMSALEALLGKKGTEIATSLADFVAVALEPDPAYRTDAVCLVKDLYNFRSRVLHREQTEGDRRTRDEARILVAGVLRAVLERRDFMVKAGYAAESPDELFQELNQGKFTPGALVGVADSAARRLWRKPGKDRPL